VLRISVAGGFINPIAQLFALPEIAIYGDGTVLAPDYGGILGSGGSVPALVATRLSEAGVQKILAAAADAGLLGKNGQYQGGPMAEASTTIFTVVAEGHVHTVSVVALGRPGGDPATQEIRDKLASLESALTDVPGFVGNDNVAEPSAAYEPDALEVFVAPSGDDPGAAAIEWPLSTPLADFGTPVDRGEACGVVTGSDLTALEQLTSTAAPDAVWKSRQTFWSLTFRPMLPDDRGCPGV
jgi:hypothetical protein